MTSTLELVQTVTTDEPAEAAHIVMVPPGQSDKSPQAYVLRARIEGFPILALCGWEWVPEKDPGPLPVCAGCLDVYQNDPHGHGDRGGLPDA